MQDELKSRTIWIWIHFCIGFGHLDPRYVEEAPAIALGCYVALNGEDHRLLRKSMKEIPFLSLKCVQVLDEASPLAALRLHGSDAPKCASREGRARHRQATKQ